MFQASAVRLVPCLVLGAFLLMPSPASAQLDESQADAAVKAALKPVAKKQKVQHNAMVGDLSAQLKAQNKAVSSGASAPGDGVASVATTTAELHRELAKFTNFVLLGDVQFVIADIVAQAGGVVPPTALIGTGSLLDKTVGTMDRQYRTALAKGRKAVASLAKTLGKLDFPAAVRATDALVLSVAPGIGPDPVDGSPGDGNFLLAVVPQPLIGTLVGSSDADVPGDGTLHISGTLVEPAEAVTIRGHGPDGETFGPIVVPVDPIDPGPTGPRYDVTVTGLVEGNWRVEAEALGVLDAEYIGVPGAPDPGTDTVDAKTIGKEMKADWNGFVKQHSIAAGEQGKAFANALKTIKADIKAGADPAQALETTFDAIVALQSSMDTVTNDDVGAAALAQFGDALDTIDRLVPEQLVGLGTVNDTSSEKIIRRNQTVANTAQKAAQSLGKSLAKSTDTRLAVKVGPVAFHRIAPVHGPELPALLVPLRVEAVMGASVQGVANDGVLWVRFTGDEALGPEITVTLLGPGDFVMNEVVDSANAEDGEQVRFPSVGPGTLPEGNYLVVLSQGLAQSSSSIAIPGGL